MQVTRAKRSFDVKVKYNCIAHARTYLYMLIMLKLLRVHAHTWPDHFLFLV